MSFWNKKDEKIIDKDIGFVEDCFEMCKNMIAFESHSLGNFMATENPAFLEDLSWMRKIRTYYLNLIAKSEVAQGWCCSKHLCQVAMNLQELTTRFLSIGDIENAKKCSIDARDMYLKFLFINGYKEEDLKKSESSA